MRKVVPRIFLGRLNTLLEKEHDQALQAEVIDGFVVKHGG